MGSGKGTGGTGWDFSKSNGGSGRAVGATGPAQSPVPHSQLHPSCWMWGKRRMWPLVALGALMLSPDLEALLGTPSACLGGILALPTPPGAFPRLQFHIRLRSPALLHPFAKHPEPGAAWRGKHRHGDKLCVLLARAARSAPCSLTLQLVPGLMDCPSSASFLGKRLPVVPNV